MTDEVTYRLLKAIEKNPKTIRGSLLKNNYILRVENFGPIKNIIGDSNSISIRKLTIFIGEQGSGKSTLAKLISTFFWLEKSLVRKRITEREVSEHFINQFCGYFGIQSYFSNKTKIYFEGDKYRFSFNDNKLEVCINIESAYQLPKIMYVPAERNFISTYPGIMQLKGLTSPLATFLRVYDEARRWLNSSIKLPISSTPVYFDYRKESGNSFILKDDSRILLENSASGFQSLVPLYVVSKFLFASLAKNNIDYSKQSISVEDLRMWKEQLIRLNPAFSDLVNYEDIVSLIRPKRVINIIEEPEQNLYPTTQMDLLLELLKFTKYRKANKLIFTTHSPYMINTLSLVIKAFLLGKKYSSQKDKISKIIPSNTYIDSEEYEVYELDNKGCVHKLKKYEGLPIDENVLNKNLAEFNNIYDKLLEIEQYAELY